MKNFVKMVIVCFVLFAGSSVFAQCVPPNGEYRNPYTGFIENSPRIFDPQQRCYVPQGTQSGNIQQNQGVQVLANQAIRIPVGGQIPQGYCSWSERLQNVGLSTLLGGIFGALVGDNGRSAGQGAAAGLIVGTVVPCAAQQQYLQGVGNTGQAIAQPVSMEQHMCPPGTSWRMLDWVGHPKHGQNLCLPSEDQLQRDKQAEIQARASLQAQPTVTVGRICPTNTAWQKLDWPGHPQNGNMLCLNSEQVARDKAKMAQATGS